MVVEVTKQKNDVKPTNFVKLIEKASSHKHAKLLAVKFDCSVLINFVPGRKAICYGNWLYRNMIGLVSGIRKRYTLTY